MKKNSVSSIMKSVKKMKGGGTNEGKPVIKGIREAAINASKQTSKMGITPPAPSKRPSYAEHYEERFQNRINEASAQEKLRMLNQLNPKMQEPKKMGGSVGKKPMTPAQKKFASLAPPKNKITFADRIAGSKKRSSKK